MAKTTSFVLGERFERFVKKQVQSGRYGTVAEVIREALREFEAREAARTAFLGAIQKGADSIARGEGIDADAVMAELLPARRKGRAG
jgi:antitoxin ParD1/3/4